MACTFYMPWYTTCIGLDKIWTYTLCPCCSLYLKLFILFFFLNKECLTDCISIDYTVQMSWATLVLSQVSFAEYGINKTETNEEHVASLHFYFPSLSYALVTNQPESLLKWLGICFLLLNTNMAVTQLCSKTFLSNGIKRKKRKSI